MSIDPMDQWKMAPGILPILSCAHPTTAANLGSSSFQDSGSSFGTVPAGESEQAVHNVSQMVASLSSTVTAAVDATSLTSVFLDECLHMFFVRFIPTFPVLHRATFVFRESSQPLLLNAMAIGSLYLGPKASVAKGEALWRLAHIAIATSWESLITHRGSYDACQGVQLVLTALLAQVYGALSKNRNIRITSQASHALGFFWARQCALSDIEPYTVTDLPSLTASASEKEHCWRTWVAKEIQKRALLGHYVLDGLIAQMTGEPPSVRHAANLLGLPSAESAFEARTADEWLYHMCSQEVVSHSFKSILKSLFLPAGHLHRIPHTASAFSLRVILEGLQSLVSDCDSDGIGTVGVPSMFELRRALARVYESITTSSHLSHTERLETYLRWHTICLDACGNSSILCNSLCSRFGIVQKVSRSGSISKSDLDLVSWANTEDARRTLLHAIAIQEIVDQLPRGRAHVIHMPYSLFAAATVYCVFALAGLNTTTVPGIVDWQAVLFSANDPEAMSGQISSSIDESETKRYIRGESSSMLGTLGATKNLMYELNSMQKLFRCLCAQWGIAFDMEDILDQWITLCH